ncbi:MAG TPA: MFS transporter [Candidatus Dormibacteraeota bacterium]
MKPPVTEPPRGRVRWHAIWAVALLSATGFFTTADMTVLPAVQGGIKAEFGLSFTQIGLLNAAFTVALGLGALPLGVWADRGSRRTVIGLGVLVWSLFTLLTGVTQSFVQMLLVRGMVGIGEASNQPAGTSLIGDYFTKHSRGRANAAVLALAGLGVGAGFIVGGVVGLKFGWRAAFFVAGGPGLLLGLLAFTIREPLRGAAESSGPRLAATRDAGLRGFGRLLRVRTFVAAAAAGAAANFGFAILTFLPLYVQHRYRLDVAQAGGLVGGVQLAAVVVAAPLIGGMIDWRARRTARAAVEVGLVGTLLAAGAAAAIFTAPSVPVLAVAMLAFSVSSAAAVMAPIVILQNVIVPSLRATAGSMNLTFSRLVGSALSPIVVGVLTDLTRGDLGQSMLLLGPAAFLLSAGCLALTRMQQDAAAMEASWATRQVADLAPPAVPLAGEAARA